MLYLYLENSIGGYSSLIKCLMAAAGWTHFIPVLLFVSINRYWRTDCSVLAYRVKGTVVPTDGDGACNYMSLPWATLLFGLPGQARLIVDANIRFFFQETALGLSVIGTDISSSSTLYLSLGTLWFANLLLILTYPGIPVSVVSRLTISVIFSRLIHTLFILFVLFLSQGYRYYSVHARVLSMITWIWLNFTTGRPR